MTYHSVVMRQHALALLTLLALSAVAGGCASDTGDAGEGTRDPRPITDEGANEARDDIRREHLELRGYGLPAPWVADYARLLKERFGVGYNPVAGCVVSPDLVRKTGAYNGVMTAEIERRHGAGVLDRLREEVTSKPAATRPAA